MDRIDARTLTAAQRLTLRQVAVRMHQRGRGKAEIAAELGVHPWTVGDWIRAFAAGGEAALQEARRGRRVGSGRLLTPAQEARLQQDITAHTPDELGLPFALWSAQAVRAWIYRLFLMRLSDRTVRKYLKRWGYTPQRALKRAYERDPDAVEHWLDIDYPAIVARAQREGADIHWGDESAVSSHEQYPRGYAPRGQTPVVRLTQAKRTRLNLLSALTNRGLLRFMLYGERLTATVFIIFLQQLLRTTEHKVFLIVDNLRVHRSQRVAEWVAAHAERIELCFLPSYSPDLNPDEYLHADFKARLNAAEPVRSGAHLKRKMLSHLRSLQKQPARLRAYFQAPAIRYAA
jgi:transposase